MKALSALLALLLTVPAWAADSDAPVRYSKCQGPGTEPAVFVDGVWHVPAKRLDWLACTKVAAENQRDQAELALKTAQEAPVMEGSSMPAVVAGAVGFIVGVVLVVLVKK